MKTLHVFVLCITAVLLFSMPCLVALNKIQADFAVKMGRLNLAQLYFQLEIVKSGLVLNKPEPPKPEKLSFSE